MHFVVDAFVNACETPTYLDTEFKYSPNLAARITDFVCKLNIKRAGKTFTLKINQKRRSLQFKGSVRAQATGNLL